MKILTFCDYFIPAYKAGGPIKTLENLNKYLGNGIKFVFVTRDRDLGDKSQFPGIQTDKWLNHADINIFYIQKRTVYLFKIFSLLRTTKFDLIYLNSFFSINFSILIMIIAKLMLNKKPILLAPRGEFSPGFLSIKSMKKRSYFCLVKLLNLYNNIYWHASNVEEKTNILKIFPKYKNRIFIATNITDLEIDLGETKRPKKVKGKLNICFISRIHKGKNLHIAIDVINKLKGNINFDIYGPVHTESYWDVCLSAIKKSPKNITINYMGYIEHKDVRKTLYNYDIFFLPTLGENYGHIILEALSTGCPVLTSNHTPWNDIEKYNAGWIVKDNCSSEYVNLLNRIAEYSEDELSKISKHALNYFVDKNNIKEKIEQHHRLFDQIKILDREGSRS